ncbi:hypothetical protein G7Y79_00077g099640 [Physcia stellaris]|nr:hypothetical protein G7Y79_00077g099640 [Physcia stellaris]
MATVFGALNRFISRLDSESPSQSRYESSASGFQVLRNKNPEIPIEPWYDFIVGINGRQIDTPSPPLLATEIRNCAGSTATLTLWSAKGSTTRTLPLHIPTPSPTLGLTLQWTPLSTTHSVWHILDIAPSSPASLAGLLPYSDYIVGTPEGCIHGDSGLGELVEDYLGRSLRLYVYNHEYSVTREISITPSRNWGGEGALGCVLGYGALHRLPQPLGQGPVAGPGEVVFGDGEESARFSNEEPNRAFTPSSVPLRQPSPSTFLVPAAMDLPPPPAASKGAQSPASGRAGRKPKVVRGNSAFEDMFKEGQAKSQEEDFAPASRVKVAPPPGGPPLSSRSPAPDHGAKTPEPEAPHESEG